MSDSSEAYPDRVPFRDRSGVVRFFKPANAKQHWSDRVNAGVTLSWLPDGSWVRWNNRSFQEQIDDVALRYLTTPPQNWQSVPTIEQVRLDCEVLTESQAVQWIVERGLEPPDCESLRVLEFGTSNAECQNVEIFDEDLKKTVKFDPSGWQKWTAAQEVVRDRDAFEHFPISYDVETLYRHPNGRWLLLVESYHYELGSTGTSARRLPDKEAADWLFWNNSDVPPELLCLVA